MSNTLSSKRAVGALFGCAALFVGATQAIGAPTPGDELLVGFSAGSPAARDAIARSHDAAVVRELPVPDVAVVAPRAGQSRLDLAEELADDPRVKWSEPNALLRRLIIPDDSSFAAQWGLSNTGQIVQDVGGTVGADIRAPAAWDITTGSSAVRVAVLDGGVDATVPDLAPNVPSVLNALESGAGRESNGIDDDGNGFVDDVRGWDWIGDDNDADDEDSISHGTHVASVIAARGNDGQGLAGIAWEASILPLRVLDANGTGTVADVAEGLAYAGSRGARVVNVSLGGTVDGLTMQAAIDAYPNTLFVVAAGNAASDNDGPLPTMPCAVPSANVICVAATDQDDELASFSNYGPSTVDLGAPGVNVLGATRGGGAQVLDGTSFSAPHTAGVAALIIANNPEASTAQVRQALLNSATPLASLSGKVATGGRLDAASALASVAGAGGAPTVIDSAAVATGGTTARLTANLLADGSPSTFYFQWGTDTSYGSQSTVRSVGDPGQAASPIEDLAGLEALTTYHARVVATDIDGVSVGADHTFTTGAATPTPTPATSSGAGPVGPVSSDSGPSTGVSPRSPAEPTDSSLRVTLRRSGRVWRAQADFPEAALVSGRLRRRVLHPPRTGRSASARFVSVRGLRRRGYAAGRRQLVLGRLKPGLHRLSLQIRTGGVERHITRSFRVSGPRRPRVSIARRGDSAVIRVQAFGKAQVTGRVETASGGRVASLPTRRLARAGRVSMAVGRHRSQSLRVRVAVWERHRVTRTLVSVPRSK